MCHFKKYVSKFDLIFINWFLDEEPDLEVANEVLTLPIELEAFEEFALSILAMLSPVGDFIRPRCG